MRHRSQLSPISVVREAPVKVSFSEGATDLLAKWNDARFFRSSAVYDSNLDFAPEGVGAQPPIRWSSVLGIGLATVVSAGFWAVLAVIIAHFWG
jgi:hypothetical protein